MKNVDRKNKNRKNAFLWKIKKT